MIIRDITRPFRRMGRRIRRVFKSKYGIAKIIILAAGLIAVTAAGILATGVLKQPGLDTYEPAAAAEQASTNHAAAGSQAATTINFGVSDPANKSSEAVATTAPNAAFTGENAGTTTGNTDSNRTVQAQPAANLSVPPDKTAASAGTNEVIQVGEQPIPASGDWLEQKIEKHKAEIDPKDLEDFRAIIAKLDQNYLQSLYNDGLTEEEQTALKDYLHSKLTGTEYSRAKQLFAFYNYLLDEE